MSHGVHRSSILTRRFTDDVIIYYLIFISSVFIWIFFTGSFSSNMLCPFFFNSAYSSCNNACRTSQAGNSTNEGKPICFFFWSSLQYYSFSWLELVIYVIPMQINNRSLQDMFIFGDPLLVPIIIIERLANAYHSASVNSNFNPLEDKGRHIVENGSRATKKLCGSSSQQNELVLRIVVFVHGFQACFTFSSCFYLLVMGFVSLCYFWPSVFWSYNPQYFYLKTETAIYVLG